MEANHNKAMHGNHDNHDNNHGYSPEQLRRLIESQEDEAYQINRLAFRLAKLQTAFSSVVLPSIPAHVRIALMAPSPSPSPPSTSTSTLPDDPQNSNNNERANQIRTGCAVSLARNNNAASGDAKEKERETKQPITVKSSKANGVSKPSVGE